MNYYCPKTKTPTVVYKQDSSGNYVPYQLNGKGLTLSEGQNEIWGGCEKVSNYLQDIEASFGANYQKSATETSETKNANLIIKSTGGSDKESLKKQYTGQALWIVSHGMNNNGESLNDLASSIAKQDPTAVVLNLNWEQGANAVTPNGTDEWINPTSKIVANKLIKWGVRDLSKVNLIGHSMGTVMSANISDNLKERANNLLKVNSSQVNALIALDAPKATNATNTSTFTTDETYNSKKTFISFAGSAKSTSAFIATVEDGTQGGCGNYEFGKTADRWYMMLMQDIANGQKDNVTVPCPSHGITNSHYTRHIILF
jgi:hypothetical protein